MELFVGKTTTERNKIIAALVLGLLSLIALFWAFGPSFRSKANVVTPTPSPKPIASANQNPDKFTIPNPTALETEYSSTELPAVVSSTQGPDSGRNIFAFYEPPPSTPYVPTPVQVKPATPTPTPPILIAYVMPQNVYAGSGGFRMEVSGEKLSPDVRVLFNGSQVPTSYLSPQKVVAEIPAALIANQGMINVSVQSPADSKLYSNQVAFNVQEPPKPQLTYVGMIARKRYNNDTAFFIEQGKQGPTAARLNDVVGGRFRLMSISSDEAILEDVNLGFRYKLAIVKTGPASSVGGGYPGTEYSSPVYNSPQGFPGIPPNGQYYPPRQGQGQQQPGTRQPRPQPSPKDADKDKDTDDDTDN